MPELISKIKKNRFGAFVFNDEFNAKFDALYIEFELKGSRENPSIDIWERHDNPNSKFPFEMYVSANERKYQTVEEGLSKYIVCGVPLCDCAENVTILPPGY